MVMNILMEVSGQARRRTQFSDICQAFGVDFSNSTKERAHHWEPAWVSILPAISWLRFQADSLTSLRFDSLPVKRDNNTPTAQGGF